MFGVTYRVTCIQARDYRVTRITDDRFAGSFTCGDKLEVLACGVELALMRVLATTALQRGKTSWMGRGLRA